MTDAPTAARILFIDDDRAFALALGRLLEHAGYQVCHAADGEEGLRLAAQDPPDLVLLDFMMPGKNGFEVCAALRGLKGLRDVPIVALTAFGRDVGRIHGLDQKGAVAHLHARLEKPVEPNVLLDCLESALADRGRP